MNLALFFEGTGQGVHGQITNVTRLYGMTAETPDQLRHLETGSGTHFGSYLFGRTMGVDARAIFARARRWFEANYRSLPPCGEPSSATSTRVFLFGFSRGALLARHFAAWLDKLGTEVAYLGLWDTVDSTVRLDVDETCPANVRRARHAVARDEHRRHFDYVPLREAAPPHPPRPARVEELLFPGSHSDVGGLYEDNHVIADAALRWIADGARACGLALASSLSESASADTARTATSAASADTARAAASVASAGTALTPDSGVGAFQTLPAPVIHDSLRMVSNLFGLLGRIDRRIGELVRHPLCDRI